MRSSIEQTQSEILILNVMLILDICCLDANQEQV